MKSSMRRASLGAMYWLTSKSRTGPPKRTGKADTSKRVIGPIPLSPCRIASHADFSVLPTGEMMPRPVMTTRRLLTRYLYEDPTDGRGAGSCHPAGPEAGPDAPRRSGSGFGTPIVDVLDSLLNRRDLLGVLIGNLDLELLFEGHDELDRVERVGSQIVHERSLVRDLFLLDAQLLGNDGFDLLLNCAH